MIINFSTYIKENKDTTFKEGDVALTWVKNKNTYVIGVITKVESYSFLYKVDLPVAVMVNGLKIALESHIYRYDHQLKKIDINDKESILTILSKNPELRDSLYNILKDKKINKFDYLFRSDKVGLWDQIVKENNNWESFKVGDKVICIDKRINKDDYPRERIDSFYKNKLTIGKEYEILKIYGTDNEFISIIGDTGIKINAFAYRFEWPEHTRRAKNTGLWDYQLKESEKYESFKIGEEVICINNDNKYGYYDDKLTIGNKYTIIERNSNKKLITVMGDDNYKITVFVDRFEYPEHTRRAKNTGLWDLKGGQG